MSIDFQCPCFACQPYTPGPKAKTCQKLFPKLPPSTGLLGDLEQRDREIMQVANQTMWKRCLALEDDRARLTQELRDTRASLDAYRFTMQTLFQKHLGAEAALLQILRDPILTDQQARTSAVNILSQMTPLPLKA